MPNANNVIRHSFSTTQQIRSAVLSEYTSARAHLVALPPSRGYTGSKLNIEWAKAHKAILGNQRYSSTKRNPPIGPATAQNHSLPGHMGGIFMAAPPADKDKD